MLNHAVVAILLKNLCFTTSNGNESIEVTIMIGALSSVSSLTSLQRGNGVIIQFK